MADPAVLKSLSRETKALILVSEFEARRMPMFQLRSVFDVIVRDEEERKVIIDMIENDLRATGYPPDQIAAFLSDLCLQGSPKPQPIDPQISATRKLKSPFAMGFDTPAASGNISRPPSSPTVAAIPPRPPSSGSLASIPPRPPSNSSLAAIPPRPPSGLRSAIPSDNPPADSLPPPDFRPTPTPPPLTTTPTGLPPPPKPPERGRASASGQRRATMMFESTPPQAPAPSTAGFIPAGEKTTSRHTLMFGGLAGAAPPPKPGSGVIPAVSAPPAPQISKRGETILLADDDKRARMIFRMRLEEAGFSTIEVGTGTEAWERIQQGGLAAAVLDMKMPGLHGLEVLSHVADKQLRIPIVICTAYDQLEDEFVVQTYPKLKYLVKPIAPETLVNAIKELIAKP